MITWWQGDEKIIRQGGVWRKEAKVEGGKRRTLYFPLKASFKKENTDHPE